MTVAEALALAARLGAERLDAQWLLADLLGRPRAWLVAHADAPVPPAVDADGLVRRLAAGEPLAYLVGRQAFHGLELRVDARVLVPRGDTETLVDRALDHLATAAAETSGSPEWSESSAAPRVLDLGTGSGAVALAIAAACPRARVTATDVSSAALEVARANGARLGLDVDWRLGGWWSAVDARRFDLVVSNPPYIPAGDPHLAALGHEPALALVSGADGLNALRAIVAGAPEHLAPDGRLLVEHGHDQAAAVRGLMAEAGLGDLRTHRDAGRRERCTVGRR